MRLLLALAIATAIAPDHAAAQIYKCSDSQGRIIFSYKPCAAAAASSKHQVNITPATPPAPHRQQAASAARDAKWEEARRFYYVEIPQLEREATELMASPDPALQALGREMAWKAQQGREAFKDLEQARKRSAETQRRYDNVLRHLGGY